LPGGIIRSTKQGGVKNPRGLLNAAGYKKGDWSPKFLREHGKKRSSEGKE